MAKTETKRTYEMRTINNLPTIVETVTTEEPLQPNFLVIEVGDLVELVKGFGGFIDESNEGDFLEEMMELVKRKNT